VHRGFPVRRARAAGRDGYFRDRSADREQAKPEDEKAARDEVREHRASPAAGSPHESFFRGRDAAVRPAAQPAVRQAARCRQDAEHPGLLRYAPSVQPVGPEERMAAQTGEAEQKAGECRESDAEAEFREG